MQSIIPNNGYILGGGRASRKISHLFFNENKNHFNFLKRYAIIKIFKTDFFHKNDFFYNIASELTK